MVCCSAQAFGSFTHIASEIARVQADATTEMFVPRNSLSFDLRDLIERAVTDWSITQPLGFTRPIAESCGDFIAEEMEIVGLRRCIGDEADEAHFNNEASEMEFREAVFAALGKWLVKIEISVRRTPDEMEEYWRTCAE